MKKRTKIMSLVLALMLVAALVPTALVQAFASDDYNTVESTPDESENDDYIESFEITKAPDKTEFFLFRS